MRRLRLGALILFLSVASSAGVASAEGDRAALLPFQGPQATKVRQNVQRGLSAKGVILVPLKDVSVAVKKAKGYAKQAAKLDASALVRTRLRRVEGRWIADTEVWNAKGRRVENLRTTSSSLARLSNRVVSQLLGTGRMPQPGAVAAESSEPEPAAPTAPRIVIRPFSGVQSAKIRGAAVRGLRNEPVELFPNDKFVAKARSMDVDLGAEGGHVAPARALAVSGLIEGDVLHEDGVWSAYVRLIEGDSRKVVGQHFYDANTSAVLAKVVQTNVGLDFRKDIQKLGTSEPEAVAVAPVAPVTAVKATAAAKAPKASAEAKSEKTRSKNPRPAAVDIEVDFRMVNRNLDYQDDLSGDLRDYQLKFGPGIGTKFQYYPGAHFTAGVGAQFGIDFEWQRIFDFESTRADGEQFPTQSQQFLIGLRWRYPKGRWEPWVVLDYGVHNFEIGVSGPAVPGEDNTAGIPSVRYEFVRFGGGFRVAIGKKEIFIITTSIAFRGVFSVGPIGTYLWFPEATANGMDAMLMFGVALPKGFEIRLGADYRRYGFDLNPVPPDPPYVAGGALDQYWGFSIGAAWRR
jgi:TolB-like protein